MYVLRSKRSEMWRPIYVAAIMAGVVMVAIPFVSTFDSSARDYLPFISVVAVLVGLVRVLNWWFAAGRTRVSVGDEVVVRSRFRTVRLRPMDVKSAAILLGEWRPEWSRWAVHPKIVLELHDGWRISRQVLLDSRGVLREGAKLQAAIARAAARRGESSDAELDGDRSE